MKFKNAPVCPDKIYEVLHNFSDEMRGFEQKSNQYKVGDIKKVILNNKHLFGLPNDFPIENITCVNYKSDDFFTYLHPGLCFVFKIDNENKLKDENDKKSEKTTIINNFEKKSTKINENNLFQKYNPNKLSKQGSINGESEVDNSKSNTNGCFIS